MRSLRASIGFVLSTVLGATVGLAAAASAWADECPGNPDALGTSRVLVLEPGKLAHVGLMQYPQSLPLADKEVVLTFDDGPLPRYSNPVLDILAAQCVKATYFLVGSMAREFPAVVRRIHEAGHTIGTHTENHPLRMHKLPIEKVRDEIDQGIADVSAALWDAKDLAPFFRIPGLNRSDAIEAELAARSLVVFSSDTLADDWHRRIKPADIVRRAMSRLEARGRGILLLHDIHAVTVAALPELLTKLKEAGFHVVHVVPGSADQMEIAGGPAHEMPNDPPRETASEPPHEAASEMASDAPHEAASDQPREMASNAPREMASDAPHEMASDPPREMASNAPHETASDQPREMANDPQREMVSVAPHETAGDPPREMAKDPQREMSSSAPHQVASAPPRNGERAAARWKRTGLPEPITLPDAEAIELPAPDDKAFATDYRPWRTVILADGSEAATHLALDAATQRADTPVPN
jgi:peptidoglycan/xylan/chitin deacetylase (PgdA/CDA1 family)